MCASVGMCMCMCICIRVYIYMFTELVCYVYHLFWFLVQVAGRSGRGFRSKAGVVRRRPQLCVTAVSAAAVPSFWIPPYAS